MPTVIKVQDLCRDYTRKSGFMGRKKESIHAVRGLTFSVEQGEIFGLLGQNGAGKTTTIKMLITLLAPTSGTCRVLGYDCFGEERHIRPRIGFIFGGERGVYGRLSARDNLQYFANLYKIPPKVAKERIAELLELVDLKADADRKCETYSKGMLQRVQIARGLINNPEVLFLDEPTVGLDPLGAQMLREIVRNVRAQGATVLLTTHNLYEADELCDRIAIIRGGELLALDTAARLKARMRHGEEEISLEETYIRLMQEEKDG
ncbi:MAG: ABC transporter ATP-binding protein [Clostridiales bacterium]|nr:ABC transporter ATP-binding protein [Clostridiales bacterium]